MKKTILVLTTLTAVGVAVKVVDKKIKKVQIGLSELESKFNPIATSAVRAESNMLKTKADLTIIKNKLSES